jgi:L-ascorbate 6-phosphate lactonase
MELTWIGQGGFYVTMAGMTVMVDPYLSDSVREGLDPEAVRLVPINERYFTVPIDVLVCTHDHWDHTDLDTLARVLNRPESIKVLGPESVFRRLSQLENANYEYCMFNVGDSIAVGHLKFTAIPAFHSDPHAVGVEMRSSEESLYITGDTLYDGRIAQALSASPDVMCVCINGVGNNMDITEATKLTKAVRPRIVIPMHWGMFAKATADPDMFIKEFEHTEVQAVKPVLYEPMSL